MFDLDYLNDDSLALDELVRCEEDRLEEREALELTAEKMEVPA